MPSLNKVILMGNLCSDVELKQTQSGVSVCRFNIGVSRRFKNADGGYDSDFFAIVAWRETAEFISKHFKKGNPICIVGELQTRNYTDDKGVKRYVTEVVASEVTFCEPARKDSVPVPDNPSPMPNDKPRQQEQTQKPPEGNFAPVDADSDLPF